MPMPSHVQRLRERMGDALLVLPSVAVLVFDEERRVLLVYHAEARRWTTPGGAVEPGELPADAVVRETFEETGLRVEPIRLLGAYGGPDFIVRYADGAVSYQAAAFEARRVGGVPRPDGVEALELGWFRREELAGLDLQPAARVVLADAFRGADHACFQAPTARPEPGSGDSGA